MRSHIDKIHGGKVPENSSHTKNHGEAAKPVKGFVVPSDAKYATRNNSFCKNKIIEEEKTP